MKANAGKTPKVSGDVEVLEKGWSRNYKNMRKPGQ